MSNIKERIKKALVYHEKDALLTLFTTWTTNKKENYFDPSSAVQNWYYNLEEQLVHNLTIENWLSFRPFVIPVIFTTELPLADECRTKGWRVFPVRSVGAEDIPVLKDMYLDVMLTFNTLFYGFSNSDILFTNSLLETLVAITESVDVKNPIMIVGKRTNVDHVTEVEGSSWQNLISAAQSRGEIFTGRAEDYFITSSTYPWREIPPLVIGRLSYDNWLVYNARKNGQKIVDATGTLLAVHQTTSLGNNESHFMADYNNKLLRSLNESYSFRPGRVDCCENLTRFSSEHIIIITGRTLSRRCSVK